MNVPAAANGTDTPATPEVMRALLQEIGQLAANARALLDLASASAASIEMNGARSQLNELGWLADVGARRCGGHATLGGAAEWFGSYAISPHLADLVRDADSAERGATC